MRLIVNGSSHDVTVPGHETLLVTLRERLQLTGTKLVCGRGECGACTVLLDGRVAYSCLTLTAACANQTITTIEGVGREDALHPLQAAFVEHDALQCGFCTPGQILAGIALLSEHPHPTEDDVRRGMNGNLCRCGAYPKILRAVLAVANQADSNA
jgi:aerobic-type carbon monoxide dehydrogenase small subunit (CoxS/CutS family)